MIHFITRLMYTVHRVLGTLLCVLFLMWFLSGFVMMYHRFPRVSVKEKLQRQEVLAASGDSLPDMAEVMARLPKGLKVKNLSLNRNLGKTFFLVNTGKRAFRFDSSTLDSLSFADSKSLSRIAAQWCSAPVNRIDTLHAIDQWIPYSELQRSMPVYKIFFADSEKSQLYLSAQDGEVLQFSTGSERFWAWMGAIPHWVYFTVLRQDTDLWSKFVICLSALGCLMVIAGFWVTIDVWQRTRRRRFRRFSPYRKRWFHWHYVSGIFFGLFVLTFTFSGMMSVADVPEWIHKPALKTNPVRTLRAHAPRPEQYALDYRRVIEAYPQALQIEWSNFREHPYYTVQDGKREYYIDAADTLLRPLNLSGEEIRTGVESIYAGDSTYTTKGVSVEASQISRFETYYRDMSSMYRGRPQLPVWKVTVNDADRSVYYIQPETGVIRYVNTSSRFKYWSYTALHRMRLPGLNSNATLRKLVLWVLLLGGTAVSLTGIVLGINYIRRKIHPGQ
ncbi:MAG: PepSY domain-containing protein [Bacteroidales bacterium]|nr:PepSY domain-containing protein [Bacteroidales bacterium]